MRFFLRLNTGVETRFQLTFVLHPVSVLSNELLRLNLFRYAFSLNCCTVAEFFFGTGKLLFQLHLHVQLQGCISVE